MSSSWFDAIVHSTRRFNYRRLQAAASLCRFLNSHQQPCGSSLQTTKHRAHFIPPLQNPCFTYVSPYSGNGEYNDKKSRREECCRKHAGCATHRPSTNRETSTYQ